jgi:hypothetical protein
MDRNKGRKEGVEKLAMELRMEQLKTAALLKVEQPSLTGLPRMAELISLMEGLLNLGIPRLTWFLMGVILPKSHKLTP